MHPLTGQPVECSLSCNQDVFKNRLLKTVYNGLTGTVWSFREEINHPQHYRQKSEKSCTEHKLNPSLQTNYSFIILYEFA